MSRRPFGDSANWCTMPHEDLCIGVHSLLGQQDDDLPADHPGTSFCWR
jgi:hypothetical protein